jgi:hypothetical protein
MNVELLKISQYYEIWADDKFVIRINREKGDSDFGYKVRASREFDRYCDAMNAIKSGSKTREVIEKRTI